jgi:hypothetical protein
MIKFQIVCYVLTLFFTQALPLIADEISASSAAWENHLNCPEPIDPPAAHCGMSTGCQSLVVLGTGAIVVGAVAAGIIASSHSDSSHDHAH